ncbi:uncharacterized protein ARMOST_03137 [Armillaria ostoyae]|uniref:Uncharacterized protein n=1 Tax=Armillaria ostoyae TaxID=47428 RepID=A0A284QTM6_ARMOS|nr:uncharacterized protein ARMOST_03137 [Armillaria ostoyae]
MSDSRSFERKTVKMHDQNESYNDACTDSEEFLFVDKAGVLSQGSFAPKSTVSSPLHRWSPILLTYTAWRKFRLRITD